MTEPIKANWIPNRFVSRGGTHYLQLAHLEYSRPQETFISYDLDRCTHKSYLPPSDLLKPGRFRHDSQPAGFIFHLSRCGSTLLSEMFRTQQPYQLISESEAIGNLFQAHNGSQDELVTALRNLIALFQQSLCRHNEKIIFKLSSWNAVAINIFQKAFPDTPCFFLYREPTEIMVSLKKGLPTWLDAKAISTRLEQDKKILDKGLYSDLFTQMFKRVQFRSEMSETQLHARLLGDICHAIANADKPVLSMAYESLPDSMPDIIAPYFGLTIKDSDRNRVLSVSRRNTKSSIRGAIFESDKKEKQKEITPEIEQSVSRFVLNELKFVKANSLSIDAFKITRETPREGKSYITKVKTTGKSGARNQSAAIVKWL